MCEKFDIEKVFFVEIHNLTAHKLQYAMLKANRFYLSVC